MLSPSAWLIACLWGTAVSGLWHGWSSGKFLFVPLLVSARLYAVSGRPGPEASLSEVGVRKPSGITYSRGKSLANRSDSE